MHKVQMSKQEVVYRMSSVHVPTPEVFHKVTRGDRDELDKDREELDKTVRGNRFHGRTK